MKKSARGLDSPDSQVESMYTEGLRPQLHFSAPKNWLNDPNGMVFHDGLYHLCYQYNPSGIDWGNMHWGHASSKDLLHWEHHPIAIPADPPGLGFAFSGCAVVDIHRTSGLGPRGTAPLVALYSNSTIRGEQSQSLYFSVDQGASWQAFAHNPVLKNPGIRDFRDPKVFWFEEQQVWIMSLAAGDKILFYRSVNLIDWDEAGVFCRSQECSEGVWECPDLFSLTDPSGGTRWVLIVSISTEHTTRDAGVQYFIGEFDGWKFTTENHSNQWLDFGPDNYGAVTWDSATHSLTSKTLIGWMSNWRYGRSAPTYPWRGHMTLPRQLSIAREDDGQLTLVSRIAPELRDLAVRSYVIGQSGSEHETWVERPVAAELFLDLEVRYTCNKVVQISLSNSNGEAVRIRIDIDQGNVSVDRQSVGGCFIDPQMKSTIVAPLRRQLDRYDVQVVFDRCCLEIFADGGRSVISANFFPLDSLSLLSIDAPNDAVVGEVMELKSVWLDAE